MPASYPGSVKTFTTKSAGQTIDPNHVNDLQLEVTAIENDLIAGLPVARGGTGKTSIGADGTILTVSGGVLVYSEVPSHDLQVALTAQVFG